MGRIVNPVKGIKIIKDYIINTDNNIIHNHYGIDIISRTGKNKVYSIWDGFVVYDIFDFFKITRHYKKMYSKAVIITSIIDGKTYHVRYMNLKKANVEKGDIVKAGDLIGTYNNQGDKCYLHIDVFNTDFTQTINPRKIFTFIGA